MEEDSAKRLLSVRATKPAATARLTGHGLQRCSEGADRQHGHWAEHLHLEMLMRQRPLVSLRVGKVLPSKCFKVLVTSPSPYAREVCAVLVSEGPSWSMKPELLEYNE